MEEKKDKLHHNDASVSASYATTTTMTTKHQQPPVCDRHYLGVEDYDKDNTFSVPAAANAAATSTAGYSTTTRSDPTGNDDDWNVQPLSMESILGIPLDVLFREVGGRDGPCRTCPTGKTTTTSGASKRSCNNNRPIMNRIEADQFIKVIMLSQELDVLIQLTEQVLTEQQLVHRLRTKIVTTYGKSNPYILPLIPILTILEQCNSDRNNNRYNGNLRNDGGIVGSNNNGKSSSAAATTTSTSSPSILHQVHSNLTQLTWDLHLCSVQLQQSAEQNWTLVDSLLDVLPPENDEDGGISSSSSSTSSSSARLLVSEKQALAELQEEVAKRISTILNLQKARAKGSKTKSTVKTQKWGNIELSSTPMASSPTLPVEQHASTESSCRTLFVLNQQNQMQQQKQEEDGHEEGQEKDDVTDDHHEEENERDCDGDSDSDNVDVYTPIADFCARIFGPIGGIRHRTQDHYKSKNNSNINGNSNNTNDRKRVDGRGDHDDNDNKDDDDDRRRRDGGGAEGFANVMLPPKAVVTTIGQKQLKRPRNSCDDDSATNEKQHHQSQISKIPNNLTGIGGKAVVRNDLNGSQPRSAGGSQQGATVGDMTTTVTRASVTEMSNEIDCTASGFGFERRSITHTGDSEGNSTNIEDNNGNNKKTKHSVFDDTTSRRNYHGHVETATRSQTTTQSPLVKGFQYTADDDNSSLLSTKGTGPKHSEDSQMSFQTKVHAAEALTGLFNGML